VVRVVRVQGGFVDFEERQFGQSTVWDLCRQLRVVRVPILLS